MQAWFNFFTLLIATFLTLFCYVRSVQPAALCCRMGPRAYRLCGWYRVLAGVFMGCAAVCYVVYVVYPLPLPLPLTFAWPWWVSAVIALLLAVPSFWLMALGVRDAGPETLFPHPEHDLYEGIYRKVRHPQAIGELALWWAIAFLLNSPFLVLYSFIWIPIFVRMCQAEEADLLLRYGERYAAYQIQTGFWWPK